MNTKVSILSPQSSVLSPTARIVEIFPSLQGEGSLLGTPMVFIRFGGCNLRCLWCDEPDALAMDSGQETSIEEVLSRINHAKNQKNFSPLHPTPYTLHPEWISLTGGEPLLWPSFLARLCPKLKEQDLKIHLETNGVLFKPFGSLNKWMDAVSMDIKLVSGLDAKWKGNFIDGKQQQKNLLAFHERFLSVAPHKTHVKIVVTQDTQTSELLSAFGLLCRFPQIPMVVLQPVTPPPLVRTARQRSERCLEELPRGGGVTPIDGVQPPNKEKTRLFLRLAWEKLPQPVRLIPQHHPIWKLP